MSDFSLENEGVTLTLKEHQYGIYELKLDDGDKISIFLNRLDLAYFCEQLKEAIGENLRDEESDFDY